MLGIGVEMRKWSLLFLLAAILSGCAISSSDYRPGCPGVRDLPPGAYDLNGSYNTTGPAHVN
jgi:hypothetical protein